jgi:hypothetical protein
MFDGALDRGERAFEAAVDDTVVETNRRLQAESTFSQ